MRIANVYKLRHLASRVAAAGSKTIMNFDDCHSESSSSSAQFVQLGFITEIRTHGKLIK